MNIIKRNFWYKLLSVAVAILLYSYADAQRNPRTTRDVVVEPKAINLPPDLVIRTAPEAETISVTGPLPAVEGFRAQPEKATVDLGGSKAGRVRLPLKYRTESFPVDVTGRAEVDYVLEKKMRSEWSVDVIYENAPPSGFQFMEPTTSPRKVEVAGLNDNVNKVARVVAILEDTEGAGAINRSVELVAQDKRQEVVQGVEIMPSRVQVSLGLKKTPASKSLLLSAQIVGAPAPGFALINYTFSPSAVTVSGAQEVLASRSSLEVPVEIDGIQKSETRTVVLPTLPGMTLQGEKSVRIRLEVRPVARPVSTPTAEPQRPVPTPTPTPNQVTSTTNPSPKETP
jgi:YbbR domain-containing protein